MFKQARRVIDDGELDTVGDRMAARREELPQAHP
jgi:hypothetical protein